MPPFFFAIFIITFLLILETIPKIVEMVIDKEKFLNIYEQLKKAEKDFDIIVSFTGGFPLCILPDYEKEVNMISNYCDAGLNQLVVDPEGNLRPCVCLREKVGNILKEDLQEVWKKNKFLLNYSS